jgi:ubiquinone/menaquinone biosynthesis C-methylase UbiE
MKKIILDEESRQNGVYFLIEPNDLFESSYINLRKKENRIYSDIEVSSLPSISKNHQHYSEWELRKITSNRFIKYFSKLNKNINILDLGCGNGWFSSQIANLDTGNVFALDINKTELVQAARVFSRMNLKFIYGNIFESIFENNSFDIITLNASIQYFNNLNELLGALLTLLIDTGEIHILDSPFYTTEELTGARERTENYYASLGFSNMAKFYFHQSYNDLNNYNHEILFNPRSCFSKVIKLIKGNESPFPWIKIVKS